MKDGRADNDDKSILYYFHSIILLTVQRENNKYLKHK